VKGGGEEAVQCDFLQFETQLLCMMDAIRIRRGEDEFSLVEGCDDATCPFRRRCIKIGSTFDVLGSTLKHRT